MVSGTTVKYGDYALRFPKTVYEIDADRGARYEAGNVSEEPVIRKDFEGMQGSSVCNTENSLIEFEVPLEQSGYSQGKTSGGEIV